MMMMIRKYFLVFLFLFPALCQAQSDGQWISLGLEGKFNKKILFEAEQGFRFSDLFTIIQTTYSDIGINYKLSKEFSVAGNYRFTQRGGMFNVTHLENRFSGEMRHRLKVNDFSFSNRLRYLSRYRDYNSSADGHVPQRFIRLKSLAKYKLSDEFSIELGTEIFWQLTAYYGKGFNNFWIIAGLDYNITNKDKISLNFIRQSREFASDDVSFGNVIALSYVHQLNLSFSDE